MKAYQKAVRQFEKAFPNKLPSEISATDVLNWRKVRLKQIRSTTWNNIVRHLHAIFKFGIEQGYLPKSDNPFKSLKVRTGKSPKKTLNDRTLRQMESLLREELFLPEILKPRWFSITLINTLRYTAIRRRQLLNLKLADIDLDRSLMILQAEYSKNHDYHVIPISNKLLPDLEYLVLEHKKRGGTERDQLFNINVFCRATKRKGMKMSDDQLSHLFRVISQHTFSTVSPHRFRHTAATELMRQSPENLYNVQKLLGHKDIHTTLAYIEYDPEIIRDCVNNL